MISSSAAGSGVAAWVLARVTGMQPKTLVPPMMFNNCGNLGLPLAVLAFGELALAPMVGAVALFRDNTVAEVREVVRMVRPALLQFHGDEEDAFCSAFRMPWLKAVPMGGGERWDAAALQERWPNADGFLFDSHGKGAAGGTGHTFDWSAIPAGLQRPFLLAGGITPDNARPLVEAGADLIAVISGIFDAPDPVATARAYLSTFQNDGNA